MRLLFAGDVVGEPGRRVLSRHLPAVRDRFRVDLVVVNAENVAAGFGVTDKIAASLFSEGVDVLTTGNHVWDKREALDLVAREPRLLRPHNYPAGTPGRGWVVVRGRTGERLMVVNVMGNVFMNPTLDCPFQCMDQVLRERPADVKAVLVDFHAETTSEKMAMGWHLDGRVSAVLGTHTHVPTADERILPGGTAYISDVGMTGCYDSVIGMNRHKVLKRFVQKLPERLEVAEGPGTLNVVLVEIDGESGRAHSIQRLSLTE